MSMKSTSPLASASIWASRSIARYTMESSFALAPHQFSLRTRVTVFAVWSTLPNRNGPALVSGLLFQPSLNTFGSLFVDAG